MASCPVPASTVPRCRRPRPLSCSLLALAEVVVRKAGYGRQLTVRSTRAAGASWSDIGRVLGTTRQSAWEAHQRWLDTTEADPVEEDAPTSGPRANPSDGLRGLPTTCAHSHATDRMGWSIGAEQPRAKWLTELPHQARAVGRWVVRVLDMGEGEPETASENTVGRDLVSHQAGGSG